MIKVVLFDMDGTLVDTERLGIRAWDQVAVDLGISIPHEVSKSFIGHNKKDVLALCAACVGSEELAVDVYDRHAAYEIEWAPTELETKEGAHECLRELANAGFELGLVTSSRTETAKRRLGQFDLEPYFKLLTCGEEAENGKPAPDIYLKAAEKFGAAPEECVVVEDSVNGARAGLAAGMQVFAIPDMVVLPDEVKDACAGVLESLLEIPAAVAALNAAE